MEALFLPMRAPELALGLLLAGGGALRTMFGGSYLYGLMQIAAGLAIVVEGEWDHQGGCCRESSGGS